MRARKHSAFGVGLSLGLFVSLSVLAPAWAQPKNAGDDAADDADSTDEVVEDAADEPAEPPSEAPVTDLEALRAEYFKLRDRLFQSRARAATVASALYSTKLSVGLDYASGRFYTVTRATIRLDGANVFDDTQGVIASDDAPRFEGFVAPGRHTMSVRIEAVGKDDERFSSIVENTVVFQAKGGEDLVIEATAQDDGNMSFNWSKKSQGSYKLHLDISIKSVPRGDKQNHRIRRTGGLRSGTNQRG